MTINNPIRARLQVSVPVYSEEQPALLARIAIKGDALVIIVRRRDGRPIADEGAGLHIDANGEEYFDFSGWTV